MAEPTAQPEIEVDPVQQGNVADDGDSAIDAQLCVSGRTANIYCD